MKMNKKWLPYVLVSPYILHFIVFVAFPVLFSLVLTFHEWNIISPMKFKGFSKRWNLKVVMGFNPCFGGSEI